MKPSSIQPYIFLFIAVLFLLSCEDLAPFRDSEVITGWEYVQDQTDGADTVKITDIQPQGAAAETASIFTLYGENFQPGVENVRVFFNSTEVTVISAGETEIEVYRPKISGDSITVKVACHDRINVVHYSPLQIATVVSPFGLFVSTEAITDITLDASENLYACLAGDVRKIVKFEYPNQSRSDWEGELTGSQGYYGPTEMKIGEGGAITYACNVNVLLRVGADGSSYDSNPINEIGGRRVKAREFDYAENGDIYAAGIEIGIVRIPQACGSATQYADLYEDQKILALRIYDGFVYAISQPSPGKEGIYGVYKNEILDDGSLGESVMVFDWTSLRRDATYMINDLTFSESGVIYVGSNDPHTPLMKYVDAELIGVYYDIISAPINELEWGTGNNIYVLINNAVSVADGCGIQKVNVGEPGAPYYGRE